MPTDPLDELPQESRRELVTAVSRTLDVDEAAAEDVVRASEPLWIALEDAGGLVDSWGGGEFCELLPRMLAVLRDGDNDARDEDHDTDRGGDDDARLLTIGAVLGDSDALSRQWGAAVGELADRARTADVGTSSPLRVNVVVHVDGRLLPNEFTGVRTGRRDARGRLPVEVAVTPDTDRDPHDVIAGALREVVEVAEAFARGNKVASELPALRRIVDRLP